MNRAIIKVSPEWFSAILKITQEGGTRRFDVIENALPSDARVVDVWSDGNSQCPVISILIESASFTETLGGRDLPVLDSPVFQVYYDETLV